MEMRVPWLALLTFCEGLTFLIPFRPFVGMNEIAFGMTFLQLARLGMDKAEASRTGVKVDARKKWTEKSPRFLSPIPSPVSFRLSEFAKVTRGLIKGEGRVRDFRVVGKGWKEGGQKP